MYYDWQADWPRVKALMRQPATQRIRHFTIEHAREHGREDDLSPYDPDAIFPYHHRSVDSRQHRGNGVEDMMVKDMLDADPEAWRSLLASALP